VKKVNTATKTGKINVFGEVNEFRDRVLRQVAAIMNEIIKKLSTSFSIFNFD